MNYKGLEGDFENEHLRRIAAHNRRVVEVLEESSRRLSQAVTSAKTVRGAEWNQALANRIEGILRETSADVTREIETAIASEWNLANTKNDELVDGYVQGMDVPTRIQQAMHNPNFDALNAFLRRTDAGMNLSDRVWRFTGQNKRLLELYVGSGITTGRSAAKISQDVRQILNEPDRLFRRVRDRKGKLVLSEAAKEYHPGRGVYRSSYKNALRMTATEGNIAYRLADGARRRQLPFILGVQVHLSSMHPRPDICDHMDGVYPTGFEFSGWHPWCICYTTSKLAKREEFEEYLRTGKIGGYVDRIPAKARKYVRAHTDQLYKPVPEKRPYWLQDNFETPGRLKPTVLQRPTLPGGAGVMTPTASYIPRRDHILGVEFDDEQAVRYIMEDAANAGIPMTEARAKEIAQSVFDYTNYSYWTMRDVQRGEYSRVFTGISPEKKELRAKALAEVQKKIDDVNMYLDIAPKYPPNSVYRGIKTYGKTFESMKSMEPGDVVDMQGFSSWTSDKDMTRKFAKLELKNDRAVYFEMANHRSGVSIRHLSKVAKENEVLFPKRSQFKVTGKAIMQDDEGREYINFIVEEL